MKLNFDQKHSHRWAEHVKFWLGYLGKNRPVDYEDARDVCYKREKLKDDHGNNYTPLLTSLMYGFGMNEKMKIEAMAQRKIIDADYTGLDELIAEDTLNMMDLFTYDAQELLRNTNYNYPADDLVKMAYEDVFLPEFRRESLRKMAQAGSELNVGGLLESYIKTRMVQEYWTLQGAVTAYHLIDRAGHETFSRAIEENSGSISREITGTLSRIMKMKMFSSADKNGMTTDHVITDEKLPSLDSKTFSRKWDVYRKFQNCPISESYRVTDLYLGEKRGKQAGFSEGKMDFCKICEKHGEQLVNLRVPFVFDVLSHERIGKPIPEGGEKCTFHSKIGLSPTTPFKGIRRKLKATAGYKQDQTPES